MLFYNALRSQIVTCKNRKRKLCSRTPNFQPHSQHNKNQTETTESGEGQAQYIKDRRSPSTPLGLLLPRGSGAMRRSRAHDVHGGANILRVFLAQRGLQYATRNGRGVALKGALQNESENTDRMRTRNSQQMNKNCAIVYRFLFCLFL